MPPFKKPTPLPRVNEAMVITFPKCEWCRAIGAHRCKGCDRYTCFNCLASYDGGKCEHFQYQPAVSTGWGEDCPQHTGPTCTACNGLGVIITRGK